MQKIIILLTIIWIPTSFALQSSALSGTRKYQYFAPRTNNIDTEYDNETKSCTKYSYITNECICDTGYHISDDKNFCIKSTPATRFDFHISSQCLHGHNTSHCLKTTHEILQLRDNPFAYEEYQERLNTFHDMANTSFNCRFPYVFDWKLEKCVVDRPLYKNAKKNCQEDYGPDAYYNTDSQKCAYHSGQPLEEQSGVPDTYKNSYRFAHSRPEYSKIYYKKKRRLNDIYDKEFFKYVGIIRSSRSPRKSVEKSPTNLWYSSAMRNKNRFSPSLPYISASKKTTNEAQMKNSAAEFNREVW